MAKYPPRNMFTKTKLIVCEGPSDEAFLRALIKFKGIPEVSIRHTGDADSTGRGGIDKFQAYLKGIPGHVGFYDLTDILIVADNDLTPRANFEKITDQLTAVGAFGEPPQTFAVPTNPLKLANGKPNIKIMMLPWTGVSGNLECLCLDAALEANPDLAQKVSAFAVETEAEQWDEVTLKGKMKLRCLLAANHRPDPFIGLGNVWAADPNLIPLNSRHFEDITKELRAFCS